MQEMLMELQSETETRANCKPSGGAAANATTRAPFDRAHLARYTLGELSIEHEILMLFAEQLPQLISSLEEAASPEDWMIAAHTLKGSSRAIGAWDLAAAAAHAESLVDQSAGLAKSREVERTAVVERLQQLSATALAYIRAEVA